MRSDLLPSIDDALIIRHVTVLQSQSATVVKVETFNRWH